MNTERRMSERRKAGAYFEILDAENNKTVGMLSDLSTGGMCIYTGQDYQSGDNYLIKIDLPYTVQGKREMTFETTSVWCRMAGLAGSNQAGFKFDNVSESDLGMIEELLAGPKFR